MECDKCKNMLLNRETSNVFLKDIGLESGGQIVRIKIHLCDKCEEKEIK